MPMRMALTNPESRGSRCFESITGKKKDYIQLTALTGDGVSFFDIHGGTDIRVPKPFLNLFHGNIVGKHQRSTGVPQIVESYFLQPVSLKDNLEMLRDILRFQNIPHRIHAHIVQIFSVV